MTEIIIYKADDGKEFLSKEECLIHEQRQQLINAANVIQKYCYNVNSCEHCPFNGYGHCKVCHPQEDWDWDWENDKTNGAI